MHIQQECVIYLQRFIFVTVIELGLLYTYFVQAFAWRVPSEWEYHSDVSTHHNVGYRPKHVERKITRFAGIDGLKV